jgi:hypothetical protein
VTYVFPSGLIDGLGFIYFQQSMIIRRRGHCYTTLWIPHHDRLHLSRLCPRIFVKGSFLQSTDNLHLLRKTNLGPKPTMLPRILKVTKHTREESSLPKLVYNITKSLQSCKAGRRTKVTSQQHEQEPVNLQPNTNNSLPPISRQASNTYHTYQTSMPKD